MIFLKNELLKWQGRARGPRTLGQPWAPQHGDPALVVGNPGHLPSGILISSFLVILQLGTHETVDFNNARAHMLLKSTISTISMLFLAQNRP